MKGHNNRGFEREANLSKLNNPQNPEKPNLPTSQFNAGQFNPSQLHPPQLHPSQLNEPAPHYYTGGYVQNPYQKPTSSSCTYVIVFLFVILMACAVLTGIYLTNKVDDVSDSTRTTKELGKLPNKLLNLGKSLIDDVSSKLDSANSSIKVNSSRIIQDNKINFNEVSNIANSIFRKINDTINEKL